MRFDFKGFVDNIKPLPSLTVVDKSLRTVRGIEFAAILTRRHERKVTALS